MEVPTGWHDNDVRDDSQKRRSGKEKKGLWWKERERERTEGEKERQIRTGNIKNTSPRTQMIMFRV